MLEKEQVIKTQERLSAPGKARRDSNKNPSRHLGGSLGWDKRVPGR